MPLSQGEVERRAAESLHRSQVRRLEKAARVRRRFNWTLVLVWLGVAAVVALILTNIGQNI